MTAIQYLKGQREFVLKNMEVSIQRISRFHEELVVLNELIEKEQKSGPMSGNSTGPKH